MKRRSWLVWVLAVLTAATLGFIFFQSTRSPEDSSRESSFFLALLGPVLQPLLGTVSETLIRKLAHFVEFFVLGAEFAGLLACRGRLTGHNAVHALFAALVCAAADETIQIFSLRGSQLPDVWLDFGAAAVGVGLICLIVFGVHRRRTRSTT